MISSNTITMKRRVPTTRSSTNGGTLFSFGRICIYPLLLLSRLVVVLHNIIPSKSKFKSIMAMTMVMTMTMVKVEVEAHQSPWSTEEIDYRCMDETLELDLYEYLDIFWFVDEFFYPTEVSSKLCQFDKTTKTIIITETDTETGDETETETVEETLDIYCDWANDDGDGGDALRGKGEAYKFVEQACERQGGRMYLAHSLSTQVRYDVADSIGNDHVMNSHDRPGGGDGDGDGDGDGGNRTVVENGVHFNVPICLAPSCDPERVIDEVLPCTQHFLLSFEMNKEWPYLAPEDITCSPHPVFNVAHSYLDEQCETRYSHHSFPEPDKNGCYEVLDGDSKRGYLCDFSKYTEPWEGNSDYSPVLCESIHADYYKYSYLAMGYFEQDDTITPDYEHRYFVNNPSCLKKGCDARRYYENNILPYHASRLFNPFREFKISTERVVSIGILPVDNRDEDHHLIGTGGSGKGKKKGKTSYKSQKSPSSKSEETQGKKKSSKKSQKAPSKSEKSGKKKKIKKVKTKKTKKGKYVLGSWLD